MTRLLSSVSFSFILLSACSHIQPEYISPDPATNAAYDTSLQPEGSLAASQINWQDYFIDERLQLLIETALENNRNLHAATARIEQARARFRIQDSRRLPTVTATGNAVRSRVPTDSGSLGGVTGGGQGANVPSSITFNNFDIGVGIASYEIDFWGRLSNLSEAARAEYLATEAAQRAFYISLIGDVASTYFDLIESKAQIALAEDTMRSREEGLRLAEIRLESGITSALDFHQSQALLTQAQQALSNQKLLEAQNRNQLTVLIGGTYPQQLPSGLSLGEQTSSLRLDAGLPSDLLLVRPDIISAEQSLRSASANIAVARTAFFPTISLTGSGGVTSSELGDLFDTDSLTWRFGPSISLPIFDAGARKADLALARAVEEEAVATYDLTIQNAFRDVSNSLAGRRWLAELVDARLRNVEAQEQIARLAQLQYDEGVANYLEVLDAERNLFTARQSLLQARRMEDQNSVSLFIALGGGLSNTPSPN